MKIIYFHQHFSTPSGSIGIRSYQMAQKLIAKGHEVTLVCGSFSGGDTGLTNDFINGKRSGCVDGINLIEFELFYSNNQTFTQRAKAFLSFAYRSVKVALSADYDMIFATTTPLTAAIPGIAARWLRRKHFIFEVRDLWPELPKAMGVITNPVVLKLMALLEWTAYKSAHGHIALSPGIEKGISRHLSASKSVATIPNGCDIELFRAAETPWQPKGIQDDDFVAVFTGTHGIANGLDKVLDVALTLKNRQITHIKFVLIGQGKLKDALVKRAEKEALTNIIFHPSVNKAQLAQLMLRADVGLQVLANIPAFYDGTSPNKFFDYLAAGLPVVNNYPGWLAKLITEHQCGVAIEPNNADKFADCLLHLSKNPEQLTEMAAHAKTLANSRFDRNKLADQFVAYFEESYQQHD